MSTNRTAPCPICGKFVRVVEPGSKASPFIVRHKRPGLIPSKPLRRYCEGSYVSVKRPEAP